MDFLQEKLDKITNKYTELQVKQQDLHVDNLTNKTDNEILRKELKSLKLNTQPQQPISSQSKEIKKDNTFNLIGNYSI